MKQFMTALFEENVKNTARSSKYIVTYPAIIWPSVECFDNFLTFWSTLKSLRFGSSIIGWSPHTSSKQNPLGGL